MNRYRHEIDNVRSHLRSLWAVIALQLVVIAGLWLALIRLPSELIVHVPPELRDGASLAYGEIPRASVYTFAFYILQQLNRWPDDGAEDYGKAIFRTAAYLTPGFRQFLIDDLQRKARLGELAHRVRGLQAIPDEPYSEARVDVISSTEWCVLLDVELVESVQGLTVKRTRIRYPLRVVRYAVDADANPWGLALAGYAGEGPTRLDDAATAAAEARE